MKSAIYRGTIRHRRFTPTGHEFTYRLFMLYLDLDELDTVFDGSRLFSTKRKALAEFRRSDHLGDPEESLKDSVCSLVEDHTGSRPDGPVRLLTHLRYFGYVFNPVSFYYCFDRDDTRVTHIVAEVNNTPWGDRHCYVLEAASAAPVLHLTAQKAMHVSPFMPMNMEYDWRISAPGDALNLHMSNRMGDEKVFDATLRLERRALNPASLARSLAAFPFMTLKVMAAIHWQALRLWLKKVPFIPHPQSATKPQSKLAGGSASPENTH